jgi:hypothetical protein
MFNKFIYMGGDEHHMLVWYKYPPFGRYVYNFEKKSWLFLD